MLESVWESMQDADFNWLNDHALDIWRTYAGKWIAVHKGRIVGVGDTATEAAAEARAATGDGEFILEAVDKEADVIYGGP